MFPFKEKKISNNIVDRLFSHDLGQEDLVWHRDHENRLVLVLESDGSWEFQLDNELPRKMYKGNVFNIPKNTYHRALKGEGDLRVRIIKLS